MNQRPAYVSMHMTIGGTSPGRCRTAATPTSPTSPHATAVLLAEQDSGLCHFHVVVDERDGLVGRVNLVDVEDGAAELGYRIGERAAGRGLATAAAEEVCRLAATAYGLRTLTAVTTLDNAASLAVLRRTGFTAPEDLTVDGRPGVRYRRRLDVRT